MKKYPDKTTFDERSLFSVLTVFTTKLHCTMNNNFKRDLQLTECEQRMVRIGNNDLNNRRLIELEYAIAYCNTRDEWHAATERFYSFTVNLQIDRSP